jgi:hypothetical protein
MANNISPTAQSALDALFASYGSPLPILSGYRDPETNARVGGARGSQHLHGNAFDVDVSGLSQAERINLANMARSAGFQGFGFYDNSMHFDVGASRAWGPDYSSGSIPSWARDWTSQNLGGGAAPLAATMSTRGTGMNGMDQQRPSGLLEFMGIQRRDPSAEGETAMPFYQRPRFADFMGGLAVGLNELRQQPSQAIPGIVAAGQERRRDARTANQTVEMLRQRGRTDLADAVEAGALSARDAVGLAYQQPDQTSAMQNYNYLINQGVSPEEARTMAFGSGGTNINLGDQEGAFAKKTGELLATEAAEIINQGAQASRGMAQIDTLEVALQQAPQGFVGNLASMAGSLGIQITENMPELQLAEAIISQLVPQQRPPGSGPMSDADLELFKRSLPRLVNSVEGNRMIVETMRAIAQYDIERGIIARQVQLGQITPQQADEAYRALPNPVAPFVQARRQNQQPAQSAADVAASLNDLLNQ